MRRELLLITAIVFSMLAGCAGVQTKYAWGSYEASLYSYYKAPAQLDEFANALGKTIREADAKGKRVAPGIYAEYGHVLQEQGKFADAMKYYGKEKQAWPESTTFMNTMIDSASAAQKKTQSSEKAKS